MTISYPLALPAAFKVASIRLVARANVGAAASPFTFSEQVYVHAGQKWEADIRLPPMKRATAESVVAWLLSLNGREGSFLMGDNVNKALRGTGGGTPLVNGGGQSGRTLAIDGLPASATGWALAGDMIQLGSGATARLHKVVTDVASNGSGQATLDLWPALRSAPADNDPVTVTNALGRWRLASNDMAWDVGLALLYGIAITATEDLSA